MSFSTIAAIATPIGSAGIGIIRISGENAITIAQSVFRKPITDKDNASALSLKAIKGFESHHLYHGFIVDPQSGLMIDEVLLSVMQAPHSYTREDVVEINSHSGSVLLGKILDLVLMQGARMADPGEFTKRAFINGRIDLTQAEAVMDIITARTDKALEVATTHLRGDFKVQIESMRDILLQISTDLEAAIDFPDDVGDVYEPDVMIHHIEKHIIVPLRRLLDHYQHAHIFRDGLVLAVVGKPNVGKSSLMNRLLQKDRVIVSEIPGTTRDYIEETANIHGIPIIIADTAGLHETEDPVEAMGIMKTREYISGADLILFVIDASCPLSEADYLIYDAVKDKNVILVFNKSDLYPSDADFERPETWTRLPQTIISARYGGGLDELKCLIATIATGDSKLDVRNTIVPNLRHKQALDRCYEAVSAVLEGMRTQLSVDLIALDLRDAVAALDEIIGLRTKDWILDQIFNRFCIGK